MEGAAFGIPSALDERRAIAPAGARAAAWERALGAHWRIVLGAYLVLTIALAALMPLRDIDLPMHLAIGEWIAQHHTVPFTEPLAWTRWGAPYYAYSWLAQLAAYAALAVVGPVGIHLLYAAIVAAAVVAVMLFGRLEGWRPWPTLLAAALHFVVLTRVTPSLRPQVALWALVPLAWVGAAWLRRSRSATGPLAALFVVSALAANTHLLFPLTGVPVFVLLANPPAERRRALWGVAAVGAGWLCSPYGFVWPEVFRLNFAPNPLFRYPSPIMEYRPGFIGSLWVGVFLAALPWLAGVGSRLDRRALAVGAVWLVGLVAFALAEKGITIWWLVSLPLIGPALSHIPDPRTPARARTRAAILGALALLLVAEHALLGRPMRAREGTVDTRTLPGPWAIAVEPLAAWLDAHARPAPRARLFTTFSYGSYLTWRLPMYSASIDSRTIFPDSVAAPEALVQRPFAGTMLGPWREADVAIVPLSYPVAAVLDTATGWVPLHVAQRSAARPQGLGLWARRAWWDSVRLGSAPSTP